MAPSTTPARRATSPRGCPGSASTTRCSFTNATLGTAGESTRRPPYFTFRTRRAIASPFHAAKPAKSATSTTAHRAAGGASPSTRSHEPSGTICPVRSVTDCASPRCRGPADAKRTSRPLNEDGGTYRSGSTPAGTRSSTHTSVRPATGARRKVSPSSDLSKRMAPAAEHSLPPRVRVGSENVAPRRSKVAKLGGHGIGEGVPGVTRQRGDHRQRGHGRDHEEDQRRRPSRARRLRKRGELRVYVLSGPRLAARQR